MSTIETPGPPELLTVAEAASILRVGRATAYRLVKAGEIPAHKFGGSIRVSRAALLALSQPTREDNPNA
jgi:excisionase family DNA binding protein